MYDYPNAGILALGHDLQGLGNPYDPEVVANFFSQSSLFRLSHVHTPVLVEAGEKSGWKTDRAYFRGLQHFHVPSEFYVYSEAEHGWEQPQTRLDSFQREIEWFDYWIKGKPYPDAERQRAYNEWQLKH
jgi:hypothetical protein